MSKLPPAVRESEFRAVETDNPIKIEEYFEPFKRELHSFLNDASCLRNIQLQSLRSNLSHPVHQIGPFAGFSGFAGMGLSAAY